jgi:AraC-like DNA-binding protein
MGAHAGSRPDLARARSSAATARLASVHGASDRGLGRGVLHQDLAERRFRLSRRRPSAALRPFVDFHWIVRWDLSGQEPHEQKILPHPNVNLAFEESGSAVFGVDRKLFVRRIGGRGKVLGVRFRPGGFRPFWNAPVSRLTDRTVPAAEVFGAAAVAAQEAIMRAPDDAGMVAHAEEFLTRMLPERDPVAENVADIVSLINADSSLTRVDQLAALSGLSVRGLQRLFAEYVGVGPKWVMRRARLHEAAQRADAGGVADWAAVAADLGYADQAHLTREFTALIGVPPTRYT